MRKKPNNLIHKRWLDRLTSETYLIVPLAAGGTGEYTEHEFVIASNLAEPMDRILECVQRRWLDRAGPDHGLCRDDGPGPEP